MKYSPLFFNANIRMVLFGIGFILGTNTSGTELHLFEFSFKHNSSRVNIGIESSIGMLLGMADILTE
jgi:hypothetical protein